MNQETLKKMSIWDLWSRANESWHDAESLGRKHEHYLKFIIEYQDCMRELGTRIPIGSKVMNINN